MDELTGPPPRLALVVAFDLFTGGGCEKCSRARPPLAREPPPKAKSAGAAAPRGVWAPALERHRLALGGLEGHVRKVPGERAPLLLDLFESVPHCPSPCARSGCAASRPRRSSVWWSQTRRPARKRSRSRFKAAYRSGFPPGPHDRGFVFGRGIAAVLRAFIFMRFFRPCCEARWSAANPPSGVQPLGSETSSFA